MLSEHDRRRGDHGPPPGIPERRRRRPTYENRITLGSIIQTVTLTLSVIGAGISAIFASGAYVQHLRDDLLVAQRRAETQSAVTDQRVVDLLQQIAAGRRP